MYKLKYEKYKQKYLMLKNNLHTNSKLNMKGGKPLNCISAEYDKEEFPYVYTELIAEGKTPFDIFLDSYYKHKIESFSILVGATNDEPNDYNRFRDSEIYSLYIDRDNPTHPYRQYEMYTIGKNFIFSDIKRFPAESVNHIHFDTGVAYSCSIDYLKLAEHILIPGGKIIFDLMQHERFTLHFDRKSDTFKSITGSIFEKKSLEENNNILINTETKMIIPQITDSKYGSNILAPQIKVYVIDTQTNKQFDLDPYRGYIEYCSDKYSRLRFEEKTYSFSDYTYPVPIRLINTDLHIHSFNDTFDFIFNQIMTLDERNVYIKVKTLTIEQINNFITRLIEDDKLKLKFYKHTNNFERILIEYKIDTTELVDDQISLSNDIIRQFIIGELYEKKFQYIEATKR
jgi:hypothetical protein